MGLKNKYGDFKRDAKMAGLHINMGLFILLMVIAAAASMYFLPFIFKNPVIPPLAAASCLLLIFAVPRSLKYSKIEEVEENLPDALKQIAGTMRAGATVEHALKEISDFGYGHLSGYMKIMLKQVREGKPFEAAFGDVARMSGSELFERCAVIIVDARKAGAGLADVMDSIADDVRAMFQVKRERLSRTTMFSAFLTIASVIIAPVIFGMVLTIVEFIGSGISSAATSGEMATMSIDFAQFDLVFSVYLMMQAVFAALTLGIVRYGKPLKQISRIPFYALGALILYEVGKLLSVAFIGGAV